MTREGIFKLGLWAILGLVLGVFISDPAFAQSTDIDDIGENIVKSGDLLPGLISAVAYSLGLLFAVLGILKLKEHVENPTQVPLRTPMIRFIIGGALFALPMVFEAMKVSFSGASDITFDPNITSLGTLLGLLSIPQMPNISGIFATFIEGIESLPGVVSAISYVLGMVLGVAGLLKLKEHVENPDQVPLREGVIRLLVGGALFALPAVFEAMRTAIDGGDGLGAIGGILQLFVLSGFLRSSYAGGIINTCNPFGTTLGDSACGLILHAGAAPAFLGALSYLFGIVLGVWGILKIRDHVLNPSQTQVWEGFSRLIAGGLFFALPVAIEAIRVSMTPVTLSTMNLFAITQHNAVTATCNGTDGLDGALQCFMDDLLGPMHSLLNFFTFTAGTLLIMIGISRLIKSAQEGAKGPAGLGTMMTFLAGGALISFNEFVKAFSVSLFSELRTKTFAKMQYMTTGPAKDHAEAVVSGILKFVILVGLISFVRGIFIVRDVAEGNSQASMMAGVTHLIGGALAVNLGPLINAVQETLGLTPYGIVFQ